MNPPRTYDELREAATKGPAEAFTHGGTVFVDLGKLLFTTPDRNAVNAELCARYWNHGPEMVAALRAVEERLTFDEGIALLGGFGPSTELAQLRAVLAALDGKDAT